ncbi:MAG TPA: HAMP domain-containing histidine kinase [Epsilonproteobacteria bacterium]|nr:HAMP domain-containing histidine kinase [Campylobacterota bacterium]
MERAYRKDLAEELGFSRIDGETKQALLSVKSEKRRRGPPGERHIEIFSHQGYIYTYLKLRERDLLLKENEPLLEQFSLAILVWLGTIIFLSVMYLLLRKSLMPLKSLHRDIIHYGEGKELQSKISGKKDEISQVSDAFYTSAVKLKRLMDSRTLFVRNIFHELNTPVTKGKLLAEIVEDEKSRSLLNSIFGRLTGLLKELAQVEQITSENYVLEKKPVRIVELMDEAKDLLYLDKEIPTNVTSEMIEADFGSMRIVFKNLIDNAMKYGSDLRIHYEEDRLSFVSRGEALKGSFSSCLEAFSEPNQRASNGFGLGLYIVNEIIQKHGMQFTHRYHEGRHWFSVEFRSG